MACDETHLVARGIAYNQERTCSTACEASQRKLVRSTRVLILLLAFTFNSAGAVWESTLRCSCPAILSAAHC